MAQNKYSLTGSYNQHTRSFTSASYDLMDHDETHTPFYPRQDHDQILRELNTLASHKIPFEYVLQLTEEPCRSACFYLLDRVNHGLDSSYLKNAVKSSSIKSDAVQPDWNKPSYHALVTCDPRGTSRTSFGSHFSGDTLVDSFDTRSPFNQVKQGPVAIPNPSAILPFRPARPAGFDNPCSYNQPTVYNNDDSSASCTQVDDMSEPALKQELSNSTSSASLFIPDSEKNQWCTDASPPASSCFQNLSQQTPGLPHSASLSPYTSREDTGTPVSARLTPQSLANEPMWLSKAPPSPHGGTVVRPHLPSYPSPAPTSKPVDFKIYQHLPKKEGYRSPCPYCPQDFVSVPEFVSHVKAKHEQPIEFICRHPKTGSRYCLKTTRESQLKRHHTKEHGISCNMPSGTCCQKITKAHQKRIWGCWFCNWNGDTIEAWAKHHMKYHNGCDREDMSFTWLVKSLLSQQTTKHWWQQLINDTVQSTESSWDLKWSRNKLETHVLVEALECGFYQDHDFRNDPRYQQEITMAIMDEAEKTRLKPVSPGNKRAATSSPPGPKTFKSSRARNLGPQSNKDTANQSSIAGFTEATHRDVKQATTRHTRILR